jgi:hypothetical protein
MINDDDELEDADVLAELDQPPMEIPTAIYGSPEFKDRLVRLCRQYKDIFSTTLNKTPADVPPLECELDSGGWQRAGNRQPARVMPVDKQAEISAQIDKLLELGIIRPSTARGRRPSL